ncbi:fasciclin domain-containing protein [Geomonas sp.]|uniref:fasciclin domain-containing protein n=1 Tax=Geomonas sp. TaxID=2651584 RepID=UPI002B48EDCF|nr:fasciclin domain-containing protein [Geomonas sp.]HJV34048.1 fasciclin domain-containing protein [Geomonas sp.]
MKNILETLTEDGRFSRFLMTLEMSGLADKLSGDGPVTLFAPDDNAFERINFGEITRDKDALSSLVRYHMVAGRLSSAEIRGGDKIYTECNKSLSVHLDEGMPVLDNAKYVRTDIECSNGIVHVIDHVFLPEFSGWYCGGCC